MQVRKELGPVDPYFNKLADGMITWIEAWGKLNPNSEPETDAEQNYVCHNKHTYACC